jgi:ribosome-associated heat shock protein Hsp15
MAGLGSQRLDKWLVVARFARTRSLAQALVQQGHVRLDGKRVTDGARKLRAGDVLTLALPHATTVVRVRAGAEKRGSFAVARELYEMVGPD